MIKTTSMHSGAIVVALAGVLFAAPVLAQGAHAVRITGLMGTKSEELLKVQALFQQPARWSEAAALLVSAAKLRDPGDPEKAHILATAARLYAYAGNTGRALYWMQQAGKEALDGGDVITAAQTLTQAAHLAAAERDWTKVKSLSQRVMALSGSPLLDDAQRVAIRAPFKAQAVAVN